MDWSPVGDNSATGADVLPFSALPVVARIRRREGRMQALAKRVCGQRLVKVITLALVTTLRPKKSKLFRGFNALGNHLMI